MENLIDPLKAQHGRIRTLAGRVEYALLLGEPAEVHRAVLELGVALTVHLDAAERLLYPELARRARTAPPELARAAADHAASMAAISQALHQFLRRYARPPAGLDRLSRDWRHVSGLLTARIVTEELAVYPLYQQLAAAPAAPVEARA